jgi:Na+-driven multidrug efflux pump
MFVIGLNQGMQPIAGYNYGAQQIDRLMRVFKLSVIGATCIMTTGWLFSMLIPGTIARMFTTDPTLINIAKTAIHFNMFMFPFIGFQMVTTNLFQCIGKVKISIFLSLSRQLLLLLPLLAILPVFIGLDGVWMSMPGSDFLASVIAFIIVTRYIKKIKNQIKPDYGKDNH